MTDVPASERTRWVRVCEERCPTCIFGPNSPIGSARRRDYEREWQRRDRFQNCHYGTVTGDPSLICRGFYDWCEATGWSPTVLQLGTRLDRLLFVPVPRGE